MSEAPYAPRGLTVASGVPRSVEIARQEAGTYSSTQVDTEHLLLGLLQERKRRKNIVAWCLDESGVTLREVREQVESMWAPEVGAGEEVEFPFTPSLRSVIERARWEARQLGDEGMSTLHLLLGLLDEPEGGAARIFHNLNVDREKARQTVMRLLGAED